jgi:zinc and cadmium transporter
MGSTGWLILYCLAIVSASLLGGAIPAMVGLNHRRLQFGLSFVSGVMLGVACFHMLPHAAMARLESMGQSALEDGHGFLDPIMLWMVLGFAAMFFLQRFAHFHQHELPQPACDSPEHGHAGHHHPSPQGVGRLTWAGAAVGLSLHSLMEGVALAASVAAATELEGGVAPTLAGLATFLVIVLHKPFDSLTLGTLVKAGGGTKAQLLAMNTGFAALVPAGVLLFMLGVRASGDAGALVPYALAFSAGTFLCIAASDLLPEVQFHRHDRKGLSAVFMLGLALAWGMGRMEAMAHGAHDHAGHNHAGHDHTGHDHTGHDHAQHDHPPKESKP